MSLKYDIVGKTFKNKKGLEFKVEEKAGIAENGTPLFKITFVGSGYSTRASSGHIRAGEVKDYLFPSVFNVGCLGYAWGYAKREESKRLYYTWRNMLRRCYDKTYSAYKWYGAKGIKVCDRWKRLDYFIEDVVKLKGFDYNKFENNEIELDKDILSNVEIKVYSPETCCFVSHKENNAEALKRRWHSN